MTAPVWRFKQTNRLSFVIRKIFFPETIGLKIEVIAVFEIVEPVSELKMYKYGSEETINLSWYCTIGFEKNKLLEFSSNDFLRFKNQLICPLLFIE